MFLDKTPHEQARTCRLHTEEPELDANLRPCDDQGETSIYVPLMNSCSLAEMMLLRWALCSRQSFSASSQVCLCVKYL